MKSLRLKWMIFVVVLGFISFATRHPDIWRYAGVPALTFPFGDLSAIVAAGQAWNEGLDVHQPLPLDPLHRAHVYGPLWLSVGHLGLAMDSVPWLGWLLVLLFLWTSVTVLPISAPVTAGFSALILLSPPFLFCMERGNNDLIIVMLLSCAAWLFARKSGFAQVAAAAVTVLTGALKIYPMAACIAALSRPGNRQHKLYLLFITGASCAAFFLFYIDDYIKTMGTVPSPETLHGYGLKVIALNGQTFLKYASWNLMPPLFIAAGVCIYAASRLQWSDKVRILWTMIPPNGFLPLGFIIGGSAWIFCFFLNSNYTYRAVLLLLPMGFWMEQTGATISLEKRKAAFGQLVLWIIVLWLAGPKLMLTTWLNHAPNLAAKITLAVLAAFEQTFGLLLTLMMTICVAGWVWRCLNPETLHLDTAHQPGKTAFVTK